MPTLKTNVVKQYSKQVLLILIVSMIPVFSTENEANSEWQCLISGGGKTKDFYRSITNFKTLEEIQKNPTSSLTELSKVVKWLFDRDSTYIQNPEFKMIGKLSGRKIYSIMHNKILLLLLEQESYLKPILMLCGVTDSYNSDVYFELNDQILWVENSIRGSGGYFTDYIFYYKEDNLMMHTNRTLADELYNNKVLGEDYILKSWYARFNWEECSFWSYVKHKDDGYKQASGGKLKIDFVFENGYFITRNIEWNKE